MKKTTTPPPPPLSQTQLEKIQKLEAKKREERKAEEDELMAMTYGPNWRTQMPPWALTYAPKDPIEQEEIRKREEIRNPVLRIVEPDDEIEPLRKRHNRKSRRNGSAR